MRVKYTGGSAVQRAIARPAVPYGVPQSDQATDVLREMRANRRATAALTRKTAAGGPGGGVSGGFSDIQFATGRPRDPLFYWRQNNLPYDFSQNEELAKVRAFCRLLYQTDPIVGSCVDIFSKFPTIGHSLECKDERLAEFYDHQFFSEDGLDYQEFLVDIGREYYTCALPGELVQSTMGSVAVQDISVGSDVLTHKGRWRKVLRSAGKPYSGRVFTIRPYYGMPIRFTEGHEFLVRRAGVATWKKIEDVLPWADELFVPVDKTSENKTSVSVWETLARDEWEVFDPYQDDDPSWTPRYAKYQRARRKQMLRQGIQAGTILRPRSGKGEKGRHSALAPNHEVTDGFLRLCGLYLAEGCSTRDGLSWAYHAREQHLVDETIMLIKQAFGLEAKAHAAGDNGVSVLVHNRTLSAWFGSMFGKGAKNKRLPSWMLRLPASRAAFVLDGLFEGDGHAAHVEGSTFRSSYKLTTSSPHLRDGATLLIRRAGFVSVISEMASPTGPWWLVSPAQSQTRGFTSYLGWEDARVIAAFGHGQDTAPRFADYGENGYWVKIHRMVPEHYEGPVYDLTVEEDASFTCQVAVHNCGEAWPFATFNEDLGIWDNEELLNPDDIKAERSPFLKDPRYFIKLPWTIRQILQTRQPVWEFEKLIQEYPELAAYTSENAFMPVSNVLLRQLKFKGDTFNIRGIPLLTRAMRSMLQQEMLNSALDSIADRLYTPLLLAKLGASATDLGTTVPWIPTEDDLENFELALDAALAGDFRVLIHNFAIELEQVFGKENMPDLTPDFERIEDRVLQVFGLSRTFLMGAGEGETYAADALNKELVTQLMTQYQKYLKQHFRARAMVVAEAQEHYDYEERAGRRFVTMEEVLEVDEETGERRIVEQPKLLVPELKFKTLNFKDEDVVRQFVEALRASGVPISQRTRTRGLDIDLDEEIEKSQDEAVQGAIAEQETRKRIYLGLRDAGLPIPDDLMQDFAPFAQMDGVPPAVAAEAIMAERIGLTEEAPTPNLAPTPEDAAMDEEAEESGEDPMDGSGAAEEEADGGIEPGGDEPQRPEESDEERAGMPKAGALFRRTARVRRMVGTIADEEASIRVTAGKAPRPEPEEFEDYSFRVHADLIGMRNDQPETAEWKSGPTPACYDTPRHVGIRRHLGVRETDEELAGSGTYS